MEIITFLITGLTIYILVEIFEVGGGFFEKKGVRPMFTRTLISVSIALVLVMLDSVLHN